ncbi:MAG: iron chelate uptake ABC transporter family permease subunit [Saccharofermentanales bacterium]|jgi:iron complex transport system permease protein
MRGSDHPTVFAYPSDERSIFDYVDRLFQATPRHHLLVTGAVGSGKSTLIQHLLDHFDWRATGYMTIRHVVSGKRLTGFVHVPAASRTSTGALTIQHPDDTTFPREACFLLSDQDGRRFDYERFRARVNDLIRDTGDVVVLDELGGDELLDDAFFERVIALLDDRSRPVIIAWKHEDSYRRSLRRTAMSEDDVARVLERRRAIEQHPAVAGIELDSEYAAFPPASSEGDAPKKKRSHNGVRFTIMGVTVFVIVILSFAIGWYSIPPGTILKFFWASIFGGAEAFDPNIHTVLVNVRLPRILLGLLVGSGLSVAGHTFQGVFRNPMVSPDVLGASSGAGLGAALAILWGMTASGITVMSFLFGMLSIAIVLLITTFVKGDKLLSLVLTGIVVSSLFRAGLSLVKLVADPTNELPAITYWLMGSLNSAQMKQVRFAAPPILIGMLVIMLMRWQLNVLTLGEEAASTMGVRTRVLRVALIIAATLITATCVSVSGVIGWIGLVVPHIARMIVGADNRVSLPASALIGSGFLLFVDDIARRATTSGIPLGILTAFIGAPFFVFLILREGRKSEVIG